MREARGPMRVLVVEDDPALGRLIQLVLGQHLAEVTLARSGSEAIAELTGGQFDAIASDISLPDMSGLQVISEARRLAPAAGIVAITGFVDVETAVRSMKAGADDFLGKPFDAEMLWHVLNKAADSRARHIAAEQAVVYRQLAYTDALTGCPNRRFIDEFLADAVFQARKLGRPLSVAYLDIDNFKLLNDFVGHEEGDRVLRRVVQALGAHIAPPALFGRFGGDEFVVVLPGMSEVQARRVLERVRRAIGEIEVVNGARVALPTRISVGVASLQEGQSPRDLVAEAEDAMYLDKAVSPAMLTSALERAMEREEALLKAGNVKALRNLVKAIDRRDSYTRFHSDHATRMAIRLGTELGLPDEMMQALAVGGPIHDLGKIVVPDEILRKPGPLTAEERRAMEEHPVMGAAITAAVTDLDSVVNLVRHHHERFDGEGYPGRLQGSEVPLATRLFSIADAFSAMTTDRPYRKGLTLEMAVEEIRRGAGSQFDPELAEAFAAMVERSAGEDVRGAAA